MESVQMTAARMEHCTVLETSGWQSGRSAAAAAAAAVGMSCMHAIRLYPKAVSFAGGDLHLQSMCGWGTDVFICASSCLLRVSSVRDGPIIFPSSLSYDSGGLLKVLAERPAHAHGRRCKQAGQARHDRLLALHAGVHLVAETTTSCIYQTKRPLIRLSLSMANEPSRDARTCHARTWAGRHRQRRCMLFYILWELWWERAFLTP